MLVILTVCSAYAAEGGDVISVDVTAGGLKRASTILTARHGVTLNYEGVPRTVEGVSYTTVVSAGGVVTHRPIDRPLLFTYSASATPQQAAEAAVAAWNLIPGVEAHYRVLEANDMLHFVPTEMLQADGVYHPYTPVLDTGIVLERTVGTPTHLWAHLIEKLSAATGTPVMNANEGWLLGSADMPSTNPLWIMQAQLDVTVPSASASARDLLDAVLAKNDVSTHWSISWHPSPDPAAAGWRVGHNIAKPQDESTLNRTPIVPD